MKQGNSCSLAGPSPRSSSLIKNKQAKTGFLLQTSTTVCVLCRITLSNSLIQLPSASVFSTIKILTIFHNIGFMPLCPAVVLCSHPAGTVSFLGSHLTPVPTCIPILPATFLPPARALSAPLVSNLLNAQPITICLLLPAPPSNPLHQQSA